MIALGVRPSSLDFGCGSAAPVSSVLKTMNAVAQAVILAGGKGTRLGELTASVPKPMLPIAGVPFLEYQMAFLRHHGVRRILVCSGYLSTVIEEHFGDGSGFGLEVSHSVETQPAGTGGCLALARDHLEVMFFVLNGDTLFDVDLRALAELLAGHPACLGALALREVNDAGRYGRIQLAGDRIKSFEEKTVDGAGWINGGVYCMRRQALDGLSPPPSSLERQLFPQLAQEGLLLGQAFGGYFIDIGLPETLARAAAELPVWRSRIAGGGP